MIRAAVIPRMHLTEWDTHLVIHILLFHSCTHQVDIQLLGQLLQLICPWIIHENGSLLQFRNRLQVIIFMGKFITGSYNFHAQILVCAYRMAGTKPTD
ncbi:hypothetical protein D1872_259390 [compost metagenome]